MVEYLVALKVEWMVGSMAWWWVEKLVGSRAVRKVGWLVGR